MMNYPLKTENGRIEYVIHYHYRIAGYKIVIHFVLFVCVEVLRPSQPDGVMSSAVSLPNHTFTGQA